MRGGGRPGCRSCRLVRRAGAPPGVSSASASQRARRRTLGWSCAGPRPSPRTCDAPCDPSPSQTLCSAQQGCKQILPK